MTIDPLVRDAWRAAEATYGARPVPLPASPDDEAAHTDTVVELVKPNRGGAGTHMSTAERRDIGIAFLTDRQRGTVAALARTFSRTREAIAGCLKGEEFEALRREVNAEHAKVARARIDGAVGLAADGWVESIGIAASKGDHRPARDLLFATKVVDPPDHDRGKGGVTVLIGATDSQVQINLIPGPSRSEETE